MMERLEIKIDKIHTDLAEINKQLAQLQIINMRHDELSRDNAVKIEKLETELSEMRGQIRLGKFLTAFIVSCFVGVIGWVVNYETQKDNGIDTLREQINDNRHAINRNDERLRDLKSELKYKGEQ